MKMKAQVTLLLLGALTTSGFSQYAIIPLKMGVLYVGVDNPVRIQSPKDSVILSIKGGTAQEIGGGMYNIRVEKPGEVVISIASKTGAPFNYQETLRAKRIPDAVPFLNALNRDLTAGEFKKIKGLTMLLPDFDFDVRCTPNQYKVVRIAANGQKESVVNEKSAKFTEKTDEIIARAKTGDTYIFTKIKYQCTGDASDRVCGQSLVYFIQ